MFKWYFKSFVLFLEVVLWLLLVLELEELKFKDFVLLVLGKLKFKNFVFLESDDVKFGGIVLKFCILWMDVLLFDFFKLYVFENLLFNNIFFFVL